MDAICSSSPQGVSFTVSTLTLPSLLHLPSSSSASHALHSLNNSLKLPVLALSTLASAPLLLSFFLSPRASRHPYLVYTSLLAILSVATPKLLPQPDTTPRATPVRKASPRQRNLEASYEVLGDTNSEAASEEDIEDVNGEDVRVQVERLAKGYVVRAGLAAVGFAMAVVGIWGDGSPQAVVYVS
jgi:autophagy-related protein 33